MSSPPDKLQLRRKRRRRLQDCGPYVLRTLLDDVPLSADGDRDDIRINCVEFYNSNLYVATSASEILHFVQIPPDPTDPASQPQYILASRLSPPGAQSTNNPSKPGVQQILLLPKVQKACVLCNGAVSFYSLPELSPIFENTRPANCGWVGGVDLDDDQVRVAGSDPNATVTIILSLKKKIRVVRIGHDARGIKLIDFVGSTISVRRSDFACVADAKSYALLDVERQLKIPLFPISSLDTSALSDIGGRVQDISGPHTGTVQRSSSTLVAPRNSVVDVEKGHARSTSLGNLMTSQSSRVRDLSANGRTLSPDKSPTREASLVPSAVSPLRSSYTRDLSPSKLGTSPDKVLPEDPPASNIDTVMLQEPQVMAQVPTYLTPHIVSPSPEEFLLVCGTTMKEPGVGMFVNLDGDVTRSTLEFDQYPTAVVSDGRGSGIEINANNDDADEEGYVLASMCREIDSETQVGIEIQRWDLDPGEGVIEKSWLPVMDSPAHTSNEEAPGLRSVVDDGHLNFESIVAKLRLRRFNSAFRPVRPVIDDGPVSGLTPIQNGEHMSSEAAQLRDEEELQFARRLSGARSRTVVWSGKQIWWAVRNPLILQLDARLECAGAFGVPLELDKALDRRQVVEVVNNLRGREAKTEIEFMSLGYIRQHAGLLLLLNLIHSEIPPLDAEDRIAEEALIQGGLDPRVVLCLIPRLRQEVIEAKTGIWIHGGMLESVQIYLSHASSTSDTNPTIMEYVLFFYKRFLAAWRTKKGFGSIASEHEVFRSVDACLLVVLLELDKDAPRGPARNGSIRSEMHHLVDSGLDCFDRAVDILTSYKRLYVLSRLYQSKKMAREVLATWRRIIEGEEDLGGEFQDGEQILRNYLTKISSQALVQEYSVWLASRNSKLGIQVFADDRSKVKFNVTEVVALLRTGAPGAVKDYLEYLVFGKNRSEYVDELIAYYLDNVLSKLETSPEARGILAQTYESYRALDPPKPTYRQFITDNAIDEEWWHSRLRLLQLLGGSHGSASEYDVDAILSRIQLFLNELVPEVIILAGRQSRHEEALRLLTHNLGDYDTATTYCLLGGLSIYHPISQAMSQSSALPAIPDPATQRKLFNHLLLEFLRLDSLPDRMHQTASLLERFGIYFDVHDILDKIPDTWAVDVVADFLVGSLRRIVKERAETLIVRALHGAENGRAVAQWVEVVSRAGGKLEV